MKQKRKIGDYATAAAGALISVDKGKCSFASIALTNLSDTPVYCEGAVNKLVGNVLNEAVINDAVVAAVDASDPVADVRGPVEFKKHLAGIIVKNAINSAIARA